MLVMSTGPTNSSLDQMSLCYLLAKDLGCALVSPFEYLGKAILVYQTMGQ